MKPKMPVALFVFILLLISSLSCQNDNEEDNLSDMSAPKLQAVYSTTCKENSKGRVIESYIQLEAEQNQKLKVSFINAEMNCCPNMILSEVELKEDNKLLVRFFEEVPDGCKCNCYYDVSSVLKSMQKKQYKIEVYIRDNKKAAFEFEYTESLDKKHVINS